jgi:hypothetical protein
LAPGDRVLLNPRTEPRRSATVSETFVIAGQRYIRWKFLQCYRDPLRGGIGRLPGTGIALSIGNPALGIAVTRVM